MSSDDLCSTRKMDIIVIDQVHVYITRIFWDTLLIRTPGLLSMVLILLVYTHFKIRTPDNQDICPWSHLCRIGIHR